MEEERLAGRQTPSRTRTENLTYRTSHGKPASKEVNRAATCFGRSASKDGNQELKILYLSKDRYGFFYCGVLYGGGDM